MPLSRGELTQRRINVRLDADAREAERLEDLARCRFLQRLDAAPFEVTEWEAQFIEDVLARALPPKGAGFHTLVFTPRQREKVDEMRKEYEGRL
jgi:hypothetical protein